MFKLSFAEILLFLIIFFVIAPTDIPNFFRKIGEYLAGFKKMWRDWQKVEKDAGITGIRQELNTLKRPKQEHSAAESSTEADNKGHDSSSLRSMQGPDQFEKDSLQDIKLTSLEQLRKDYDFSRSLAVFKMLFDRSPSVREKASEVLQKEPVFSFEAVPVPHDDDAAIMGPSPKDPHGGSNTGVPIEELFADQRIGHFSRYIAELPLRYAKSGINYLSSFPGNDNLDLDCIFNGEKQPLLDDFKRLQLKCRDIRSPGKITVAASYTGSERNEYGDEQKLKERFPDDMGLDTFRRILDIGTAKGNVERVVFLGGEPTVFPRIDLFLDEIGKRSLLTSVITGGLTDTDRFRKIVERDSPESVVFLIKNEEFPRTDGTASNDTVYTKEQLNVLTANIAEAVRREREVSFRYTINNPDKRDWRFLDSFQGSVPRFVLRTRIAMPDQSAGSGGSLFIQLKRYREAILSLISHFTSKPYSREYRLVLENPYPLCFFGKEELYYVLRNMTVNNVYLEKSTADASTIDRNNHINNFMFHPDGSYSLSPRVVGSDHLSVPVRPLENIEEDVSRSFLSFRKTPVLGSCIRCSLYSRGLCQVGRYTYADFYRRS